MNDPKLILGIVGVVAVVVIAVILLLRHRLTGFKGQFSKKGVNLDVQAAQPDQPPALGVDLSGADFKDKNKFAADNEARVKARNLKAGTGNKFQFGSSVQPADKEEPKK